MRCLQTMVLSGHVKWHEIKADVLRKVRPNLFQLQLDDVCVVPQSIMDQLKANRVVLTKEN